MPGKRRHLLLLKFVLIWQATDKDRNMYPKKYQKASQYVHAQIFTLLKHLTPAMANLCTPGTPLISELNLSGKDHEEMMGKKVLMGMDRPIATGWRP